MIIMNNRIEIAQEFANSINSENIVKIILFGSVARNEDTEDSDIDILIISPDADALESKIDDLIIDFILDKNELIYAHLMTEDHFNETKDYPFLQNVMKDGVVLAP